MSAATASSIQLPTDRQRQAYLLRAKQGLDDTQVGRVLGVSRESANRLINAYLRRESRIRLLCAQTDNCGLLALLAQPN